MKYPPFYSPRPKRARVASLIHLYEAEPPEAPVHVHDPGELSEAADAFQSHDEEGSEDA